MSKLAKIMNEADAIATDNVLATNLSITFQRRAKLRAELHTGIAATLAATLASNEAGNAVDETANAPMVTAAQAVAEGDISKAELSEMLCEAFGRGQDTKDGKPSKTPAGYGLSFRKRAVCLSEAMVIAYGEVVSSEDLPKWAQGKEYDDIKSLVTELLAGEKTASVTYKELTEREKTVTVDLQFNPERLAKLAAEMAKPETMAAIMKSPALIAAYEAIALAWANRDEPIAF